MILPNIGILGVTKITARCPIKSVISPLTINIYKKKTSKEPRQARGSVVI